MPKKPSKRTEELYARLGPVLFARANRALRDDAASEKLILQIVTELATLDAKLTDAELLKRGREKLEHSTSKQVDSIVPGLR